MIAFSSPYPGLRPFDAEEADLFFGRQDQVDELLRRLHATRFLAVVGPSGCGKSSLVRAGMIAALESGFLVSAGSRWQFAVMRPGGRPMTELATAVVDQIGLASEDADRATAIGMLGATLRRGPLGLVEALRETPLAAGTNLLVLVDQFEEIFRFRREGGVDEADAFVALLLESARQREAPIYVVLTMRSDFFGDCAAFAGLPEALNQSQYLTPRLSREQRRAAIVGPARVFGGDVAPNLVNRLLNEMGNDPDQLPLMQHLLMRMWTWQAPPPAPIVVHAEGGLAGAADDAPVPDSAVRKLTLDDYNAVGGLRRALSNHANEAFDGLDPRQQAIAEILFRRLSERAPGSRDIRRPTAAGEVAELAGATLPELTEVVNVFRAPGCSFVVPAWPIPIDENTILDITHEALIRQWDRLRTWADDEAQSAENYRFLDRNAHLWQHGRMALWGTPHLEMALDWRTRQQPTELWARRYGGDFAAAMRFLDASAKARATQEAEQQTRRLRQVRHLRRVAAASVLAALLSVGTLAGIYWFFFAEHVAYYKTFARHWGEPVGIGELTAAAAHHRTVSLKFTQRGIHYDPDARWGVAYYTNQIEAVDADGDCTPNNQVGTYLSESDEDYSPLHECRWSFVRDATTGQLVYENAYDKDGKLRRGYEYLPGGEDRNHRVAYYVGANGSLAHFRNTPASVIHITYSDRGYEIRDGYFDQLGTPQPGPDHAFGRRFEYDQLGRLISMTSLDAGGKDLNDTAGNATMRTEYDAADNSARDWALDATGRPGLVKEGWHERRWTFDQYDNEVSYAYFDKDGHPALDDNGVHLYRITRDDKGWVRTWEYYDREGHPTTVSSVYKIETRSLGPYGNPIDKAFFDAEGHKAANTDGVHEYRYTYDPRGFKSSEKTFGIDSQPIAAVEGGCYEVRYDHDAEGNTTTLACFGKDGTPALGESGFHSAKSQFDERGEAVERRFFDRDGHPTTSDQGYHLLRTRFDQLGNAEEDTFYDIDGQPTTNVDGYHRIVAKHDGRGNETERSYYDTAGQLVAGPDGYAKRTKEYDAHDNAIKVAYYDGDSELTEDSKEAAGYAIVRSQFDEKWRATEIAYFGKDDAPKARSNGYATRRISYTDNGQQEHYFDTTGHPLKMNGCAAYGQATGKLNGTAEATVCLDDAGQRAVGTNGISVVRTTYDDHGHILETAYFGKSDEPVKGPNGVAVIRSRYDDAGHQTEEAYYGVDGKPVAGSSGAAALRGRYDAAGHEIELAYYDTDGRLWAGSDGYAIRRSIYDDHGKLIGAAYFGTDDRPAMMRDGYHRLVARYDERERIVERTFYGVDGKPVALPAGYAIRRTKYDNRGEVTEESYFGPDERPVVTSDGYHRLSTRYDEHGHLIEKAFYGADEKLMVQTNGYAVVRMQYDDQGREVDDAYLGPDGQLVSSGLNYSHRVARFTDNGNSFEQAFYGADDKLRLSPNEGYAMARIEQTLYDADGHFIAHCVVGATDATPLPSQCTDADGHRVGPRVVVSEVMANSQAEHLGMRPGDVLESYAGQEIRQGEDLRRLIAQPIEGARTVVVSRGPGHVEFAAGPGVLGIEMQTRFVPETTTEPVKAAN